jgi:threonyl-tRNA synthetase
MLTRIYGTAWAEPGRTEAYLHMLEEAEKRDHRKLGREMDLFHFQEEGPGVVFWHSKGWKMFQNLSATCAGGSKDYEEVNAPQILDKSALGNLRPLGLVPGEHVRGEIRPCLHQSGRRRGRQPSSRSSR